jgi:sugar lactone lactonase YvrE
MQKSVAWIWGVCTGIGVATQLTAGWVSNEAADVILGDARLPDPWTLRNPSDVDVDGTSGKVFVVDAGHHRVLRYPSIAAYANGEPAEAVLGQADLYSAEPKTTAAGLNTPSTATLDAAGRLWVLDAGNYRVLRWDQAATVASGAPAVQVLGQSNFVAAENGGDGRMSQPTALAVDSKGRLFVGDMRGMRILRYDGAASKTNGAPADGVLGQPDFQTFGVGKAPNQFEAVNDLAVDAQDRLWVADYMNNRVVRFDAPASGNNLPANAVLGQPDFDSTGRQFGPSVVGMASSVVIGQDGTLYVGDGTGRRVLRWKNAASLPNGTPADGVLGRKDFSSNAEYGNSPAEWIGTVGRMGLDGEGHLWLADVLHSRILRWDEVRTRPNGAPADGVLGAVDPGVLFRVPPEKSAFAATAVLEDPVTGKFYVADYARVLRFRNRAAAESGASPEAALGKTSLSSSGSGAASRVNLRSAWGLALDAEDRLWVSDRDGNRVVAFDQASTATTGTPMSRVLGQPDFVSSTKGLSAAGLSAPRAIALDASGNLWVADSGNHRVVRFNAVASKGAGAAADAVLGQPDLATAATGNESGRFNGPRGLVLDASGRLWVADTGRHRLVRYNDPMKALPMTDPSGTLGRSGGVDALSMREPSGVAVTRGGRLWVADMSYNRVLRFENAAQLTNTAPASGVMGAAALNQMPPDGRTRRAFWRPMGVSLDANESLWVADVNNARLLRFTPDPLAAVEAMERTAAGVWRMRFSTQGAGSFTVQSSTDLKSWTDEAAYKLGAGVSQWHERPADGVSRFFRIFEP